MTARTQSVRTVDGYRIEVITSTQATTGSYRGAHIIGPAVIITASYATPYEDNLGEEHYDVIARAQHDAPGHEVQDMSRRNRIGEYGALVFEWAKGWDGDWLDARIEDLMREVRAHAKPANYRPPHMRDLPETPDDH